ncbi:hypothetical protein M218_13975 [Burkholderia pseudomallei MSHR338]|nr:hypothetical protein M218_13975 [Burkholderia pseudomallei MSHR338]
MYPYLFGAKTGPPFAWAPLARRNVRF